MRGGQAMSDASEVKRYIPDSTPFFLVGESTPEPTTCVVLGRDHDRIVAELKAEVARQERVIEKLKNMVSHYETCATVDCYDEIVSCDCGLDKELSAIEKEEGK